MASDVPAGNPPGVGDDQDSDQLGPFQALWDAWDAAHDDLMAKPLSHYRLATGLQFDELEEHLARGDRAAAAREAVDIISLALNTLRWMGYRPEDVAEFARTRAQVRMQGRAHEILDKYERRYGL
ncbi:hypothetical protein AB0I60_16470 [Actinosynnema sp. NPDC050436]|uniref:hypothetical protein n=1 Tax=Actinosynnema sp. NPDC050436 TaxID=3155659 RepID=UPI00340D85A6